MNPQLLVTYDESDLSKKENAEVYQMENYPASWKDHLAFSMFFQNLKVPGEP
jgi:hypothetical protein